MADRLLGVLGHKLLELCLGLFVPKVGFSGPPENRRKLAQAFEVVEDPSISSTVKLVESLARKISKGAGLADRYKSYPFLRAYADPTIELFI